MIRYVLLDLESKCLSKEMKRFVYKMHFTYHVFKYTCLPKQGEQLEVFIELNNAKDKFAICVNLNKKMLDI